MSAKSADSVISILEITAALLPTHVGVILRMSEKATPLLTAPHTRGGDPLHEVADALRPGCSETGAESAIEELFTNRYGEDYAHSPIGKRERATAVKFYLERR